MTDEPTTPDATLALPGPEHGAAEAASLIAGTANLPLALRVMLNPVVFAQVREAAKIMSDGGAFIPKHLSGKPRACFAVILRAWDWKLDPYWVAQCTYETPNGQVGFEGKLCQAILENSGRFVGGVRYEHHGDWGKILGRFKIVTNARGHAMPKQDWTEKDEVGLGVTVIGQVRGEVEPRRWSVDLVQAFPRNSPLWATDPRSQICYLAVRRFGDIAAPGIYGGVRFNVDEFVEASDAALDVTPLQTATQRDGRRVVEPDEPLDDHQDESSWTVIDNEHTEHSFRTVEAATEALLAIFKEAAARGVAALDAAWEGNEKFVSALAVPTAEQINQEFDTLYDAAEEKANATPFDAGQEAAQDTRKHEDTAPEATTIPPEKDDAHGPSHAPPDDDPPRPAATADPPKPIDPFWSGMVLEITPEKRTQGRGVDWPKYAAWMERMVGTAPTAERLLTFRRANARSIADLKSNFPAGYVDYNEAADARAKVLGG